MTETPTNIHRRRLRAIFMMELRIGLYQWLTRISPGRQPWGCFSTVGLFYMAVWGLFRLGSPSLASELPHHALAAPLWLLGGAVLIWWPWAALTGTEARLTMQRACPVVWLLPLSRRRFDEAALLGRITAFGLTCGPAGVLMFLAHRLAEGAAKGPPSLVPVAFWAFGGLSIFAFGCVVRHFDARARRAALPPASSYGWNTLAVLVGIAVGLPAYLVTPGGLRLCIGFGLGALAYGLAMWRLVRKYGAPRAAADQAQPESAPAEAERPRRFSRLDLGWLCVPEHDFRRWARAATVAFAALAVVATLFVIGWPLGVRAIDIGRYVLVHHAWPTAPVPSDPGTLSLGAHLCLWWLPFFAVVACTLLWSSDVVPSARSPQPEFFMARPHIGGMLPRSEGPIWRAKLLAALVWGGGFALMGEAFAVIGHVVATLFGGAAQIPLNWHWGPLTGPALALIVWAQRPMLQYPLKLLLRPRLAGNWIIVWVAPVGAIMVMLVAMSAGMPAPLTALRMNGGAYAFVWPMATWAVALLTTLGSRLAYRPSTWPLGEDGSLDGDRELFAGLTAVMAGVALAPLYVLIVDIVAPIVTAWQP